MLTITPTECTIWMKLCSFGERFKTQKDRLTFATTICMDGSVLPLHAIGTSRMPRAVSAAYTTPATILNGRWTHNRKAWMTTEVFCEWLLDLNHFFRQKHQNILLVDNCPAHKLDSVSDKLDFVKVVFLPANVTSLIHICDAGVIKAFKAAYRRHMLHKGTH